MPTCGQMARTVRVCERVALSVVTQSALIILVIIYPSQIGSTASSIPFVFAHVQKPDIVTVICMQHRDYSNGVNV